MKKLLFVCMLILVCATGCASKGNNSEDTTTQGDNKTKFSYIINGVEVVPGDNAADTIKALGEPASYNEAASCYFEGMDKQYTYDGFEIRTYPSGSDDIIQDICVTGGTFETPEGIKIGSELSQVTSQYGTDYTLVGKMYKYYTDDTHYTYFFMMDDAVKYFGYAIEASN